MNTKDEFIAFVRKRDQAGDLRLLAETADTVEVGNEGASLRYVWPPAWQRGEHLAGAEEQVLRTYLLGRESDLVHLTRVPPQKSQFWLRLPLSDEEVEFSFSPLLSAESAESPGWGKGGARSRMELEEILALSSQIHAERDMDRLLATILSTCRHVTGADAGSLYVIDRSLAPENLSCLRFKCSQNDSVQVDFSEFNLEISGESIVGQAVLNISSINVPDLYDDEDMVRNGWRHDRSFDRMTGYESHSMLTVPLLDKNAFVVGVVQLINRKKSPTVLLRTPEDFRSHVLPFDRRSEDICRALASLAGIALENTRLYDEVRDLFEGLVRAAITAIESRDPSTMGHSKRVTELSLLLADEVHRCNEAPFQDIFFHPSQKKELEYACLLHDFGKIGVREEVLQKPEKLYPEEKALVFQRFESAFLSLALEAVRTELRVLQDKGCQVPEDIRKELEREFEERKAALEESRLLVQTACRPTVLEQEVSARLEELERKTYFDAVGDEKNLMSPKEIEALRISRGSLTEAERQEIERHVVHSANFLRQIPWGSDFAGVPLIAAMHHERVNGSGYPLRMKATQIPLQSRIMAVCDMFDALTAADRPYKKAIPASKALEILRAEASTGGLDPNLVEIFIGARLYETTKNSPEPDPEPHSF